jgi:polyhydroxybutyrate depolymerase
MKRRIFTIIAVLCFGLAASNGSMVPAQAAERTKIERGLILESGNQKRTYNLQRAKEAGKHPLILLFHGNGGSADQVMGFGKTSSPLSEFLAIGQRNNVVIAAANGLAGSSGSRGWNDCRNDASTNPDSDDVAFVRALIDKLVATAGADAQRVYAVGMSNGSMFTLRLALEAGDRFAGFGMISGAFAAKNECVDAGVSQPIVLISGTADPIIPFAGGAVTNDQSGRGTVLSNSATVALLVARAGASATPQNLRFPDTDRRDGSTVTGRMFAGTSRVAAITVNGGGHVEPSKQHRVGRIYERVVGRQNHDFETADFVWRFLTSNE